MTLSVWRFAHLALAIAASLFLVLASATGIILAIDAAGQQQPPYSKADFNEVTLAQLLPILRENYLEVSEISVSHNRFVTLKGLDADGNETEAYIHPETGKVIGKPKPESSFIKWVTSLHRSLFMHQAGRIFVGINAFLLIFIALSGMVLVIKRQKGFWRFFTKITKDSFAQYYHVVLGRLLLMPILIIALSGTYLSMQRFKLFSEKAQKHKEITFPDETPVAKDIAGFALFKQTRLADVQKIEFPFDPEDPEELFTIKLKDRELKVSQFTGEVLSEVRYPITVVLEDFGMDLHTGRSNVIWAVVLCIASASILFFIYSGFAMTFRRRSTRIKNKYAAQDAAIILLAGSENGSTLGFANAIHSQLLAAGHASYLAQADDYTLYPKAIHIILFTSTHGLGDAPSNAKKFLKLIDKYPQAQNIKVAVVGFGSKAYPDFCGFAKTAESAFDAQPWTQQLLPLYTVNDKSATEFTDWVSAWGNETGITLATTPALYNQKPKKLQPFKVINKIADDHTFILTLRAPWLAKFTSGDLLAIYPGNDITERLYSIGKVNGKVQLVVKLHENGLGSGYLNSLQPGDMFKARIVMNQSFHLPEKPFIMVANGTGIAPFLGMFAHAGKHHDCHLYCGFRNNTVLTEHYRKMASVQMKQNHLKGFHMAFSREDDKMYVMDLINRDASFFVKHLEDGGIIMLCGAIAMQQDVELLLDKLLSQESDKTLYYYKEKRQLLADCY